MTHERIRHILDMLEPRCQRVASSLRPASLLDRLWVVLQGVPASQGADAVWVWARPAIVRQGYEGWDDTLAAAASPGQNREPFKVLQRGIARRRGLGWTNSRIARDLGISARTVTNELGLIATHWREFIV